MSNEVLAKIDLGYAVIKGNRLKHLFKAQRALIEYAIENSSEPFYICASAELSSLIQILFTLSQLQLIPAPKIFSPRLLTFNKPSGAFSEKDLTWHFEENTHFALGGPRSLTFDDFLFAVASRSLSERPREDVYRIMLDHSFWVPANWFYPVNLEALARLITVIGDPRWHLTEDFDKKRYRTVFALLGLNYINFKLALINQNIYENPVLYALASWGDPSVLHSVITSDNKELASFSPYNKNIFISKFAEEVKGREKPPLKVMYRITLQFVAAFCESWVNFLSNNNENDISIIPFEYKDEHFIDDYKKYMSPLALSYID